MKLLITSAIKNFVVLLLFEEDICRAFDSDVHALRPHKGQQLVISSSYSSSVLNLFFYLLYHLSQSGLPIILDTLIRTAAGHIFLTFMF